jgi:hypothetical protein
MLHRRYSNGIEREKDLPIWIFATLTSQNICFPAGRLSSYNWVPENTSTGGRLIHAGDT